MWKDTSFKVHHSIAGQWIFHNPHDGQRSEGDGEGGTWQNDYWLMWVAQYRGICLADHTVCTPTSIHTRPGGVKQQAFSLIIVMWIFPVKKIEFKKNIYYNIWLGYYVEIPLPAVAKWSKSTTDCGIRVTIISRWKGAWSRILILAPLLMKYSPFIS